MCAAFSQTAIAEAQEMHFFFFSKPMSDPTFLSCVTWVTSLSSRPQFLHLYNEEQNDLIG